MKRTVGIRAGPLLVSVVMLLAVSVSSLIVTISVSGDTGRISRGVDRVIHKRTVTVKPLCLTAGEERTCRRVLEVAPLARLRRLCETLASVASARHGVEVSCSAFDSSSPPSKRSALPAGAARPGISPGTAPTPGRTSAPSGGGGDSSSGGNPGNGGGGNPGGGHPPPAPPPVPKPPPTVGGGVGHIVGGVTRGTCEVTTRLGLPVCL